MNLVVVILEELATLNYDTLSKKFLSLLGRDSSQAVNDIIFLLNDNSSIKP